MKRRTTEKSLIFIGDSFNESRLDETLRDEIDALAKMETRSRTGQILVLLREALEARKENQKKRKGQ